MEKSLLPMENQEKKINMKELRLNNKYLGQLIEIIKVDNFIIEESTNVNIIKGDDAFFENLLDHLSNYLIQNGLDENDEPNSIGIEIEELIDKVSEVYYS